MNYCSDCGGKVELKIPDDDNRERYVCTSCGMVHYQNPNMVVGTIPIWINEKGLPCVLLCKRNIEPRLGFWTVPAGFLENGETTAEGAARETLEESCAKAVDLKMYRLLNVPRTNQIHLFFSATLETPHYEITSESSAVAMVAFDDIPWSQLAFPTVYKALKDFVNDWPKQEFLPKDGDIGREDWVTLDMKLDDALHVKSQV